MSSKRDDIKKKYNVFFDKLAKDFKTELLISEKPFITNYENYKFETIHNFYFNFKNGINIYVEISENDKNIIYSAIKIDNIKDKKLASDILLYIDNQFNIKYAEIILNENFLEAIDISDFKKIEDEKEELEELETAA